MLNLKRQSVTTILVLTQLEQLFCACMCVHVKIKQQATQTGQEWYLRKNSAVISHEHFFNNWCNNSIVDISLLAVWWEDMVESEGLGVWVDSGLFFDRNFPPVWVTADHRARATTLFRCIDWPGKKEDTMNVRMYAVEILLKNFIILLKVFTIIIRCY